MGGWGDGERGRGGEGEMGRWGEVIQSLVKVSSSNLLLPTPYSLLPTPFFI
ncbi:MAG: hypothetical protein F6K58_16730 [Symploca sp. SIO2E9]|nr:hypothetical protein [Symploca sp. SIO2E9]